MNIEADAKNALITAATTGIGRATARGLATLGYSITITYLPPSNESDSNLARQTAKAVEAQLLSAGAPRVECVPSDLSKIEDVRAVVRVAASMGPISVVVNNSGAFAARRIRNVSLEQIHKLNNQNIVSTLLVTGIAEPFMCDGGAIVNVTTAGTHTPYMGRSAYLAAKGAIEAFTRAAAAELAPRQIRVNTVAPGITATESITEAYQKAGASATPFGRIATPEDIADVIIFLSTRPSRWVTGQIIVASGGIGYSL